MTRQLADGWRVIVRLVTDAYRTVIDRIHVEAGDDAKLRGIRGQHRTPHRRPRRPDVATGHPRRPSPRSIHRARKRATTTFTAQAPTARPPCRSRRPAAHRSPRTGRPRPRRRRRARGFTAASTHPAPADDPPTVHPRPRDRRRRLRRRAPDRPSTRRQGTQRRLDEVDCHYARSSIGPLINQARAADLLTPTARGIAGGDSPQKPANSSPTPTSKPPGTHQHPPNPAHLPKLPKPHPTVAHSAAPRRRRKRTNAARHRRPIAPAARTDRLETGLESSVSPVPHRMGAHR